MNVFSIFKDKVEKELQGMSSSGTLPSGLDLSNVKVEPPRDPSHGDAATNAAMVLAKPAAMKPREIAQALATRLEATEPFISAEVAGPGFVNLRVSDDFWRTCLAEILQDGARYGDSALGAGRQVNVEYVSANPTGPLTVGHARGAVFGDALANLLEKAGFAVTKEYYINDAGAQVDVLARSTYLRYREALGETIGDIPEGYYPGEYLRRVGRNLAARDGKKWQGVPEEDWLPVVRQFAIDEMMELVRADLKALGVEHDVFISERALVDAGRVEEVFEALKSRNLVYIGVLEPPKGKKPEDWEPRPQTLFRATDFGDDVDRPLMTSDGSWTYFASDMANHLDKYRRGARIMIDVWGADHGGYVKRMEAAVRALTENDGHLDVRLCQLVKLLRGGVPVKMSKRAGTFVTLRDVIDEVGKDVVRFIMLTRKNDAPLEFDLEKVLEQSRDNPVFYVQYAHARVCSVMRHAAEAMPEPNLEDAALAASDLARLTDSHEIALIKFLGAWPRHVESAAEAYEPHRVAFYLYELAAGFHALWTKGKDEANLRFLVPEDPELSLARLALIRGVALVIASGLRVMGVTPVEEMR